MYRINHGWISISCHSYAVGVDLSPLAAFLVRNFYVFPTPFLESSFCIQSYQIPPWKYICLWGCRKSGSKLMLYTCNLWNVSWAKSKNSISLSYSSLFFSSKEHNPPCVQHYSLSTLRFLGKVIVLHVSIMTLFYYILEFAEKLRNTVKFHVWFKGETWP